MKHAINHELVELLRDHNRTITRRLLTVIIRAIVDIELKKDGKWVITSLESLDTPLNRLQKPKGLLLRSISGT